MLEAGEEVEPMRPTATTTHRGLAPAVRRLLASILLLTVLGPLAALGATPPAAATSACPSGLVALTVDDGPGPHTAAVLDVLDKHAVPATFFVVGTLVTRRPATVRQAAASGHEIANHSHTHPQLARLSNADIRSEIQRADAAIRGAGVTPLPLLRPPYGSWDGPGGRVASIAAEHGYRVVTWNVDPTDYRASTTQIRARVRAGLRPGAVILLHDGSGNAPRMVAALPGIIRDAHDRGYCFGLLDARGEVAASQPGAFRDITDSPHREAIEQLAEAGITRGCDPPHARRYCPADGVTRAQFATLIVGALDASGRTLPEGSAAAASFIDVETGSTHAPAILRLTEAGVILGCDPPVGERYCPADPLTRAQLATLLARALDLEVRLHDELHPATQRFLDVPPDTVHAPAIACLCDAGITWGCNPPANTRFCPGQTVTRGQLASFLVRAVLDG